MMSTKTIIHRLPLTKARINLGAVVRRVHLNREYVILEKDGIPVAGLMNIDEMEDYLEQQDPKLKKQIAEGYQEYRSGKLTETLDDFRSKLKEKSQKRTKRQVPLTAQIFRLLPTTRFKREVEKTIKEQPELAHVIDECSYILRVDPYNFSRQYPIKKLTAVKQGEGQGRIRSGKYRLRCDIFDTDVVLYSFRHRKEAY